MSTQAGTAKPPVDWNRAAAEFEMSAVMWHALADSSRECARPGYGHLATDFGGQIGDLYRRMAQVAESFASTAKEIAFAEAHPDCEGDCADVPA